MTAPTMGVPANPWYAMERFADTALARGAVKDANTASAYAETWLALRAAILAYARECAAEAEARGLAAGLAGCVHEVRAARMEGRREVLAVDDPREVWCPEGHRLCIGGGCITCDGITFGAPTEAAAAALDSTDPTPDTTGKDTPS